MTARQLKNSILQMAVQGKLVSQDPNDEPACILLKRIREEKEKLIKAGKIKREKNPSEIFRGADNLPYEKIGKETRCIADEIPFEIPDSWEWVCLEQICIYIQRGKSPKYSPIKKYPVIAQKCNQWTGFSIEKAQFIAPETISSYSEERFMQDRDLLWNSTGLGTLGRMAIYRTELNPYGIAVADSHVTVIRPCSLVLPEFLFYYFANPTVQTVIEEQADGSTKQKELSRNTVRAYWVPLPPLAEQKRIVAKIEELLPHLEDYDRAEMQVSKLNAEFPEQLKKSILQWAIQGKLVPQDPADKPASVLLERIRAEKAKLVKAGKIKKDKNESVIFRRDNSHYEKLNGVERCIDDEIPFEIPDSWAWVRLGTYVQKLTDGTHFTPRYVPEGIPFLSVKDISGGMISFDSAKYISAAEHSELFKRCNPQRDDILLTKVGTTGIPVLVDTEREFSIFVSVALLKFSKEYINKFFFVYLLQSPLVQDQCAENTKGVGNKNWVMKDIYQTLLAIPPLAEQKRIVAEIERLFSLQRTMRRS